MFDDAEEISKFQKLYKKYDQIISGIEFDSQSDKILLNAHMPLNYVKINLIIEKLYRNEKRQMSLQNHKRILQ